MADTSRSWRAAGSCVAWASPTSTMMKLVTSSSVAVSLGSRARKRIVPSGALRAPKTMTRPSTSSALAKIEPTIDVCATTTSPARRAKMTTKSSGRLPSVDCSRPVAAAPKRSPTCSVASETTWASPARATVATAKASSGAQSA